MNAERAVSAERAMSAELRERVARYLDGVATGAERAEVERRLLDDDVARLLAEEVVMRDLLRSAPPLAPPAALAARWEDAVLEAVAADQPLATVSPLGWVAQALDVVGRSLSAASAPLAPAGAGLVRLSTRAMQATVANGYARLRGATRPTPRWRRALAWLRRRR